MKFIIILLRWYSLLRIADLLEWNGTDEKRPEVNELFALVGYPKSGDIPILNRKVFKALRVGIREHPYVVSIRRLHSHYLTGSLITRNMVITVAHSLYNVPVTELGVVAGESHADRGNVIYTVVLVVIHQDFDPYTLRADLALIRIYEDINYKSCSKSIQLASMTSKAAHRKAFVTGWGRCDSTGSELCLARASKYYPDEKFDPMLRSVSFDHTPSNPFCDGYQRHEVSLSSGMLCTGPAREKNPVSPCLAVPGAPLVVGARLLGILSWGFGCGYGHDLPLVYTNLQAYLSWILKNIVRIRPVRQDNLTALYEASKSYVIVQWLMETRVIPPTISIKRERSIEPLPVDSKLAKLDGILYDVRDFVENGTFHIEKQAMYEYIRYTQAHAEILMNENLNLKRPSPKPFLEPTGLEDYNVTETEAFIRDTTKTTALNLKHKIPWSEKATTKSEDYNYENIQD